MEKKRCFWVDLSSPVYIEYHDKEWGIPVYDDEKLYEMFLLETFQAGLSWITILKKREFFREAFDGFDVKKIAAYGTEKVEELMQNPQIIRNRGKITAAVHNAAILWTYRRNTDLFPDICGDLRMEDHHQSGRYNSCKDGAVRPYIKGFEEKRHAVRGSVTIYSYLQAVGVVNDHDKNCFCKDG